MIGSVFLFIKNWNSKLIEEGVVKGREASSLGS